MTTRQQIVLLIGVSAIAALVGCGGGSSTTTPPPPTVSIAFGAAPPSSLTVSQPASVSANVSGDSSNAGVDWTVTCGSSACGSFSPAHTASGVSTTYTAPPSVPSGGKVSIVATATADATKSVAANVTITATPIVVSFNPAPPILMQTTSTKPITAVVAHDSSNAGVDWSVTCGSSDCGSFDHTHTNSGSPTNYTAPATVPSGGSVKVTATSTADATKSISANISISALPIVVTFNPAPPPSMQTYGTSPITAHVANDPTQAGVNWTVTCGSSDCGYFTPTHTDSDSPTTYNAPANVPTGNKVTITATSTADSSKSVSAQITITLGALGVFFQPQPPSSVLINSQTAITAVVHNDPSNEGVDWSVTCGSSGCGSFSPTHTASGVSTTYTAPASVPTGGSVTITASSTAQPSVFVQANIEIATIIVAFDPAPTPFMIKSSTAPLTAVVSGDTLNEGVDWNCQSPCTTSNFNPAHTASGQATTFTAPSTTGNYNVTATSTADPNRQALTVVTVASSFNNAALNGNYVFAAAGRDTFAHVAPGAYQIAGVLTADGAGNITGGEQIYEDQPQVGNGLDTITGTYSIGTDGRGTLTIDTGDTAIGVNGVETFSVVMLGGAQGLITQFDSSASSSGTLDLQTPSSKNNVLSGGYAFVTNGVEAAFTKAPLGIGGIFNVDGVDNQGNGTISGNGTVMDVNDAGTITSGASLTQPGSVVPPDQLGKVVINLDPAFPGSPALTFVGFIIDDTHVKLIERDQTFGTTSGAAYAQGTSTGTFTNASFNTTVVYSTLGYSTDSNGPLQPTAYAGVFDADGVGDIGSNVGYTDENQFGLVISDTLSGSYAADSNKTGRVTTSGMFYGSSGQGPKWILYLTGASDAPALILQVDGTANFIETVGTTYTQTATSVASFTGSYGMGFAYFAATGGEDDGTGQATASGASGLSGNEDLNVCNFDVTTGLCSSFTPNTGLALTGGPFSNTSGVPGRFTGPLNDGTDFNLDPIAFYIADGTRVLFIDTGSVPAVGVFRQQQ